MDMLKDYYKEQSASQPNPSLRIEHFPAKAKQLYLHRGIAVAIVIALSLGLATTAYAAVRNLVERVQVGVSDTYVVVHDESHTGHFPAGFQLPPAFENMHVEGLVPGEGLDISDDVLALMNNAFIGSFFYEDGSVVESAGLWLPPHARWYSSDGNTYHLYNIIAFQNKSLYDSDGNELGWISWNPFSNSFDVGIAVNDFLTANERYELVCDRHEGMTCNQPEHAGLFCAGSYEEAAALLERDFRLPDIPGYVVNLFEMQSQAGLSPQTGEYHGTFYAVVVVMHHIENDPNDSDRLIVFRAIRDDTAFIPNHAAEVRVAGSIEELFFNGIAVYAIAFSADGIVNKYIWEHEGLTYEIFARSGISHTEYLRIIASMLK
jgi:hypothetical protein